MSRDFFEYTCNIPQDKPVLMLAPMEGITNSVFRDHIVDFGGLDICATEFIRITSANQRLHPIHRHPIPTQIQFMVTEPCIIAGLIKNLKEKGLINEDDWLDLNVGCPSRQVNSSGAGAALLKTPEKIVDIVEAMRSVHDGPLSVKTRIGFSADSSFEPLIENFQRCPIDFLTVHARNRCDKHSGPINYNALAEFNSRLPYPVIGNGNIFSIEDGKIMLEKSGVRGLMIGRGAAISPFIFQDIRSHRHPTSLEERNLRIGDLNNFVASLIDGFVQVEKSKDKMVGTFKEFATWFSMNPLIGKDYFKVIKRLRTFDEIKILSRDYLCRKKELMFIEN